MTKYRTVTLAVVALLSVSFLACPIGKGREGGKASDKTMEPREMKGRDGTKHPGMDK